MPNAKEIIQKLRDGSLNGADPGAPLNLAGLDFSGADLSSLNLSFADLTGADFSHADLSDAVLFQATLDKALFEEATLDRCELTGASLQGANFNNAQGSNVGMGAADLTGSTFVSAQFRNTTFTKARLGGVDFRMSVLYGSRMMECDLAGSDLTNCDLRKVNFSFASFENVTLRESDLRGASLSYVKEYESADWFATDFRAINFVGAYQLRRFIIDQNYLEEFRRKGPWHKVLYFLWWITSDCGRSMLRWVALTMIVALLFASLFTMVRVDYGAHQTALSPFYFSVVTLTTLGFGDVVPVSIYAQILVIIEVIIGYGLLGGALAIFSNKIARRGD